MKKFHKILRREVDEQNRTIFVIENTKGEIESVLYSELDMEEVKKATPRVERTATVVTKFSGERIVIKSHDEHGNKIDQEKEKDKFLHPEKYDTNGHTAK